MGFAEFTIGPAKGRTRWLNPSYADCAYDWFHGIDLLVKTRGFRE